MRRTGRKVISIMCCAAQNRIPKNGIMFAKIRCALDWLRVGKIGHISVSHFRWNIDAIAFE